MRYKCYRLFSSDEEQWADGSSFHPYAFKVATKDQLELLLNDKPWPFMYVAEIDNGVYVAHSGGGADTLLAYIIPDTHSLFNADLIFNAAIDPKYVPSGMMLRKRLDTIHKRIAKILEARDLKPDIL